MGVAVASSKPFINHVSDAFLSTRKGLDKGLKAGKNLCTLIEFGARASDQTSVFGETIGKVGKEMGYLRKTIKVFDFVDNFRTPDKPKEGAELGFHIAKTIGFAASDAIETVLYTEDIGLTDLGQTGKVIGQVGAGLAGAALTIGLVETVSNRAHINAELERANQGLESLNDPGIEDGRENADKVKYRNLKAVNEFALHRNTLDIIQTVFDIAAIIFGFCVIGFEIAASIAIPLLALLGLASAITGLCKLWVDTGVKPTLIQEEFPDHPVERNQLDAVAEQILDLNTLRSQPLAVNS